MTSRELLRELNKFLEKHDVNAPLGQTKARFDADDFHDFHINPIGGGDPDCHLERFRQWLHEEQKLSITFSWSSASLTVVPSSKEFLLSLKRKYTGRM